MDFDYRETNRFRALLDANGVFWSDVEQMGKRRTCFKMDADSSIYWYADQMGGSSELFLFCQTWDPERLARELGLETPKNPWRNADENAAAFADAPTLETAREPMQTPVFELGA